MKKIYLILSFLILPIVAEAQLKCTISKSAFSRNISIQGAPVTVGDNVAVGTVIYSGYILTSGATSNVSATLNCKYNKNEPYNIQQSSILVGGGNQVSPGIYATNLPGVGLRIYNAVSVTDNSIPLDTTTKRLLYSHNYPDNICNNSSTACDISVPLHYKFELVKTGTISAGQVDGTLFPRISVSTSSQTSGAIVDPGEVAYVTFFGSLNIKAASCTTPGSYTVDLGTYDVQEIKENKMSPWIDASIILTGCPTFTGMPGSDFSTWLYPSSTQTTSAPYKNNLLEVTLKPVTGIRDASQGVFIISEKGDSASGVDIQLSAGTPNNNKLITLNNAYTIDIPFDSQSTIKVPLVARYVINDEKLSPGKADGQVTYLINYK